MSYPTHQGPPVPPGPAGHGPPGVGGYPPPSPPKYALTARAVWAIGGVAAVAVVLLLTTVGVVMAVSGDDTTTPTANASPSSPLADESSGPEPDDESSPSDEPTEDESDDSSGGTHQAVEHMCQKLDGSPLRALYDTVYGRPSESRRQSTDHDQSTCVTTLIKGSNRRQSVTITCSGYFYHDDEEASRFYDAMVASSRSIARGPIEDVPGVGDKALIYTARTSSDYHSFRIWVRKDNLVLSASVMANYPPGWQPATINQLKQGVVDSAKSTVPKLTS